MQTALVAVGPELDVQGLEPVLSQDADQGAAGDLVDGLQKQQAAVAAALVLRCRGHGEAVELAAAGLKRRGEGEPGHDPGNALAATRQVAPPGIRLLAAWQRQHADGGRSLGHGAQHAHIGLVAPHGVLTAEVVAGQLAQVGAALRRHGGDREGALHGDEGREDLAPDPDQHGAREGAGVAGDEAAQHLGLAGRAQEDRVLALGGPDRPAEPRPAHQKVVELGVDLVDLPAQIVERRCRGRHGVVGVCKQIIRDSSRHL